MANNNFVFNARVFATPSAATVLFNGTEIFSGQVGAGQPLDTVLELTSVESDVGGTVTISVTSGVLTIGDVIRYVPEAGTPPQPFTIQADSDARISSTILINGQAPEWPATPVTPMPGGTPENPDWRGWFFEVSAGETITFDLSATDIG